MQLRKSFKKYENLIQSPVGMKVKVPIILSHKIAQLEPRSFFLGGGEVDLKLELNTDEFIKIFNPYVTDITMDQ